MAHPKAGGRTKGTPNKKTLDIAEKLARLKCDPIEGMAKIALGDVPCGVCRGKGRTPYKVDDKIFDRLCESCYGTLFEPVSPELRGKMLAELAQYLHPKRKAIEHTGLDGGPIQHTIKVRYVTPDHVALRDKAISPSLTIATDSQPSRRAGDNGKNGKNGHGD